MLLPGEGLFFGPVEGAVLLAGFVSEPVDAGCDIGSDLAPAMPFALVVDIAPMPDPEAEETAFV